MKKINSEELFDFINNLGTNEKVKFRVYYDDQYITEIYWDGENFNWESGTFSSGVFFNPLYDFEEILDKEDKKIEKLELKEERYQVTAKEYDVLKELIDEVNKLKEYNQ